MTTPEQLREAQAAELQAYAAAAASKKSFLDTLTAVIPTLANALVTYLNSKGK